jgi:hypothetical protein
MEVVTIRGGGGAKGRIVCRVDLKQLQLGKRGGCGTLDLMPPCPLGNVEAEVVCRTRSLGWRK